MNLWVASNVDGRGHCIPTMLTGCENKQLIDVIVLLRKRTPDMLGCLWGRQVKRKRTNLQLTLMSGESEQHQ
jgi:hypothetical protein